MQLNKAQQEAARHREGPCMVLAGPGSGKTLTIAARIRYLIEKCKVRPEEILVITFTRYAARQMKERFEGLMGAGRSPVTFGTFHGIYYGILKWAYGLTSANIMAEEEKRELLRQILSLPQMSPDMEIEDEKDYLERLLSEMGKVKNSGIRIAQYESQVSPRHFQDICRLYEEKKKEMRKIDFDDMLLLCWKLFKTRPDVLERWQKKFRYILVDEFQDVNRVQYEVLRMLALPENNLFVVGDDDQSIYQFRGARPGIMLGFPKDYPGAKKVLLDVNYRCTPYILKGAVRVIGHNKKRYPKKLRTVKDKGALVHVQEVKDPTEEAGYIISAIQKRAEEGTALQDMAVLFRTNLDAGILAGQMMERHMPFSMREYVRNVFEHFIGRNIRSYMELACGRRDRKYFLDIANCPKRYISRESMERGEVSFEDLRKFYCDKNWMQDRIDQLEWDIRMMEHKTPFAAIQYIRKRIGYDDYLREWARARRTGEEELFEMLEQIQESAKAFRTMEEWFRFTDEYGRNLREQQRRKSDDNREGICLMTMHSAKGLEFDTVFILGANEGVTPYKKAKLEEEIEEERRMFYVAMTRAKEKLVITYVKTKNGKDADPSRFVEELLLRGKKKKDA